MSTYVAVFALVLAYVALVAAYLALRTLAKLRRATSLLSRERGGESLMEAVHRQAELTELTREEVGALRTSVAGIRAEALSAATAGAADVAGALRNVALVRYDAFDGMSGRMSFSVALLDETGDGVTISALAGPADTRVYAKGISTGRAAGGGPELSPEERQAIEAALAKRHGLLGRRAG